MTIFWSVVRCMLKTSLLKVCYFSEGWYLAEWSFFVMASLHDLISHVSKSCFSRNCAVQWDVRLFHFCQGTFHRWDSLLSPVAQAACQVTVHCKQLHNLSGFFLALIVSHFLLGMILIQCYPLFMQLPYFHHTCKFLRNCICNMLWVIKSHLFQAVPQRCISAHTQAQLVWGYP